MIQPTNLGRRRLGPRAVAAVAVLAITLCACADGGATADGVTCGEERHPPEQSGGHLIGDGAPPVPYSSTPPTSGWHASGNPPRGVHGPQDPLSEPEQVTILELGGIVISWNGLSEDARTELERFVADRADVVASTPYDPLDEGQVAMAGWGVLRVCDGVDIDVFAEFMDRHAGGGPPH